MIFSGVFVVVAGLGIMGFWTLALVRNGVPEVKTEPIRIAAHIIGEYITAIMLVLSGSALLLDAGWAESVYLLACGMLIYTVIVSPGYYAQQRKWPIVGMFAVILIFIIINLFSVF